MKTVERSTEEGGGRLGWTKERKHVTAAYITSDAAKEPEKDELVED